MISKISDNDAKKRLGKMLEDVCYEGNQYVIERGGRPMAALVPLWQLEEWRNRRGRFFGMVRESWKRNRARKPKGLTRDVKDAVTAARQPGWRRHRRAVASLHG
jgi:antitoxin (DNA-binding transcriptional repressor) of toxin-antitoxin stability system